jgi:protein O-GlcNAc transferase
MRRAIEVDPSQPQLHMHHGRMLWDQGRFDEAIEAYREWADSTEEAHALHRVAELLEHRDRDEEAVEYHKLALAGDPHSHSAHHLPELLWTLGREDEAVATLREIIGGRPDEAWPLVELAQYLLSSNQSADALVQIDRAIALDGDRANDHYVRAQALFRTGREVDAYFAIEEAVRLDPNHSDARTYRQRIIDASRDPIGPVR